MISIDESVVPEYLMITGLFKLAKSQFQVVRLNNTPAKELAIELENKSARDGFDHSLRFKSVNELTNEELSTVISFYNRLEMPSIHKKARRKWIESKNEVVAERERRGMAESES